MYNMTEITGGTEESLLNEISDCTPGTIVAVYVCMQFGDDKEYAIERGVVSWRGIDWDYDWKEDGCRVSYLGYVIN